MYSIERMKNAVKINLAAYNSFLRNFDDALIETCNFFGILPTRDKEGNYKFLNGKLEELFTITKEEVTALKA